MFFSLLKEIISVGMFLYSVCTVEIEVVPHFVYLVEVLSTPSEQTEVLSTIPSVAGRGV